MKYRFVNEHRHQYAITTMCQVLQIARAGFYQWLHKPVSDREQENIRLLQLIHDSYGASRGVYSARRVFGDLREAGETCCKHRVARLMRAHKIKALRGYKAPRPIAGRPSIIAPNHLNREFTVDAPNKAWVTDITYIRTWQGWLYLAVVVDLYARKVVSDQGSQYGSDDWKRFCAANNLESSMSRRGNCWDMRWPSPFSAA